MSRTESHYVLVLAKRFYRFLDAAELTIRAQHLVDAKPRHGGLRADRLEAGDRKIYSERVTFANEVAQNLGRGKVDFDDARCLQHDQPHLLRRGLQRIQDLPAEMIGVEKGQWRLKSRDDDAGLPFTGKIRTHR